MGLESGGMRGGNLQGLRPPTTQVHGQPGGMQAQVATQARQQAALAKHGHPMATARQFKRELGKSSKSLSKRKAKGKKKADKKGKPGMAKIGKIKSVLKREHRRRQPMWARRLQQLAGMKVSTNQFENILKKLLQKGKDVNKDDIKQIIKDNSKATEKDAEFGELIETLQSMSEEENDFTFGEELSEALEEALDEFQEEREKKEIGPMKQKSDKYLEKIGATRKEKTEAKENQKILEDTGASQSMTTTLRTCVKLLNDDEERSRREDDDDEEDEDEEKKKKKEKKKNKSIDKKAALLMKEATNPMYESRKIFEAKHEMNLEEDEENG